MERSVMHWFLLENYVPHVLQTIPQMLYRFLHLEFARNG